MAAVVVFCVRVPTPEGDMEYVTPPAAASFNTDAESDQLERAGMAGSFLNTAGTLSAGTADINMGGIP